MRKGPRITLRGPSSSGSALRRVPRAFVGLSAASALPPLSHQFPVQFQLCNYILHAQAFMAYQLRPNGSMRPLSMGFPGREKSNSTPFK
jgi:hypothetical protein